jgi:predicted transcriptional regulator
MVSRELLVVGPAALPELPEGGEDLPHLILVEKREIDMGEVEKSVRERIGREVEIVISKKDRNQMESLLDVCYDLEMWVGMGIEDIRKKLEEKIDHIADGEK